MRFTTNYSAVFRTYQAEDHFDEAEHISLAVNHDFSPETAWWMCAFARWAYRDTGASHRAAQHADLVAIGFTELAFFSADGIHASLVRADDPDIAVLSFRGTSRLVNWKNNLAAYPLRRNAHVGFELALDKIWPQIKPHLDALTCPVYVTGHSLGGALATLTARRCDVFAVYTLGCPPLGNETLRDELEDRNIYRLANYRDFATRNFTWAGYHHVGSCIYLGHEHQMIKDPETSYIAADQQRGVRCITSRLNQGKLTPLPELVTDHSPQNYVAGFANVCVDNARLETPDPVSEVARQVAFKTQRKRAMDRYDNLSVCQK